MRKWVFVVGFLICSILFFLSGILTGYLYCEKSFANEAQEKIKFPRQASHRSKNALIGRIINKQIGDIRKKTRVPTIPALQKAQKYRDKLVG